MQRFNISNAKAIKIPLANHFKLSNEHCPYIDEVKKLHGYGPIYFGHWKLMYPMVCMKPYINYEMGVMSRFMSNPRNQH